jgi:steroid delta-isomerase-like uncharacterized protein
VGEALDVVQRFYDAFGTGDLDAADALFADDCRFVMPPGELTKTEHRMMAAAFRAGLPDSRMVIDHVLDGGAEVFVEGHFVGTHTGDLVSPQGTVPASGRSINVRFADYFQAAAGQITDHRTYWDQAEMMAQLGAA